MSKMEDIEDIFVKTLTKSKQYKIISDDDELYFARMVMAFCSSDQQSQFEPFYKEYRRNIKKDYGIVFPVSFNKVNVLHVYNKLLINNTIERNAIIERFCVRGETRENSGVLVVTLVMSPYPETENEQVGFTCKFDCHFCPKYPGMPRSYIADEPAVARAINNDWDPIKQFLSRVITYKKTGMNIHDGLKVEVILEGGTFNSYPEDYRRTFINKVFYIANLINYSNIEYDTFSTDGLRKMKSMEEEQTINETAFCKIVGLSIETRPDCITKDFIIEMRECGITRVQVGVQHIDNKILRKVNRGCTHEDTMRAMEMLVSCAFKVAIHIMPDLPGSSYEKDYQMFLWILQNPDFLPDFIKIYPVSVTKFTKIKEWYDKGLYKPYSETKVKDPFYEDSKDIINPLIGVIAHFKGFVPEFVRIERVFRDFPTNTRAEKDQIIFGGCATSNLRQETKKYMYEHGLYCKCIRCREVGNNVSDKDNLIIIVRQYKKFEGIEYFISIEDENEQYIHGFCRMRLPNMESFIEELNGHALIRELHVYGKMNSVGNKKSDQSSQHMGFGSRLLSFAEQIAASYGYKQMSVISAVGTRGYYRKKGYIQGVLYQTKKINIQGQIEDYRNLKYNSELMCFVPGKIEPLVEPQINYTVNTNTITNTYLSIATFIIAAAIIFFYYFLIN